MDFTNFRYRLMQFLSGRYGTDSLFYAIFAVCVCLAIINIFLQSIILQLLIYAVMVYGFYRAFSRNISARAAENRKFNEFINRFKNQSDIRKQRKADSFHIYKKCRRCGAVLRLPRRVGKHKTVCPKCGNEFSVHVRK